MIASASRIGRFRSPDSTSPTLRITIFPAGPPAALGSAMHVSLPEPVFALALVLLQAADAREWPAGLRHDYRHQDLVRAWRVGQAHFHAVEMAAHEGGVLMTQGHVDRRADSAHLLG